MLDEGAVQLDRCAALPHRSWAKIRKKIAQLRGKDFEVVKPQVQMKQHETIEQYLKRNPEQAVMMNFSVSGNCSPQKPQNGHYHRSGDLRRLNIVYLFDEQFLERLMPQGHHPSP